MTEPVVLRHEAKTVTLLLNRPTNRNALSHDLLTALAAALARKVDPDITGIIITGCGNCFSAGADYRELTGTIKDRAIDEKIEVVTDLIRASAIPVTAAVNGACLGGAVDLALACHRRTATRDAYFQVPASKLGLLYNPVSVQHMVLRYGADIVSRLLVMGERFDAPTALAEGLVSAITGSGDSDVRVQVPQPDQAKQLGPVASATKQMIDALDRDEFDPQYWQQVRLDILGSKQRFEAVAEFKARMQNKPSVAE